MATIFNLDMHNNNENFDLSVNDSVENFVVEFGEITYLTNKDFNKLDNRPSYNGQTMTGDTNIPKVPTAVSELDNDSDYQTGAEVEAALATKQDILTAGDNIDIDNNVISATDTTYSAGNGLNLSSQNAFSVDTTIVATQQGLSDEVTNRENADIALQAQIDGISASSDVVDIVGTYADLEDYDTSKLKDNDIIKVLQDSTQNNATTYYRWSTSSGTFTLIGQEGPYYTKAAAEAQFVPQTRTVNGKALSSNITLNASDVSALGPNDVVQTTGSSTTQIMSQKAVTDQLATKLNVSDYVVDSALADSTNPVQNKVLNNLLGNMPTDFFTANATVAGEGTSITLNKTMSAPIKLNSLNGDTFQQTYSGKNQLSYTLASLQSINTNGTWTNNVYVYNGITYTVNDDLTINVNGSTAANTPSYFMINNSLSLTSSTNYILNGCPSGGGVTLYSMRLYDGGSYTSDTGNGLSFTYGTQNIVRINIFGGITVTNKLFKPMIRLATVTDDTYEKFVGGIASPNPSYPQDIDVVTGEQTVQVTGKNLCEFAQNTGSATRSDIVFTVNNYSQVTMNGTSSGNQWCELLVPSSFLSGTSFSSTIYIPLDTNKTYTFSAKLISGTITGTQPDIVIQQKNENAQTSNKIISPNDSVSFTGSGGIYRMWIRQYPDTLATNAVIGIQLEENNQATAYEPYQSQDYKVNLVGKNLFDGEFRQGNYNNASDAGRILSVHSPKLVSGEEYTVSCSDITGYRYAVLSSLTPLYPGSGGTLAYDSGWQTSDTFTFTANGDWYIAILVSKPNDGNLTPQDMVGLDWQVEESDQSTDYTPYYNYELAKIGTYQDYIYKSGDDWYVHKALGRYAVNTDDIELRTNYTNVEYAVFTKPTDYAEYNTYIYAPISCTHAIFSRTPTNPWDTTNAIGGGFTGASYTNFWIGFAKNTGLSNIKTALAGMYMYYALATPTDTKITDATLISELNALQAARSYLDTTYFLTTANGTNLPVILDLEAYTKSLNGILGYIGDN